MNNCDRFSFFVLHFTNHSRGPPFEKQLLRQANEVVVYPESMDEEARSADLINELKNMRTAAWYDRWTGRMNRRTLLVSVLLNLFLFWMEYSDGGMDDWKGGELGGVFLFGIFIIPMWILIAIVITWCTPDIE